MRFWPPELRNVLLKPLCLWLLAAPATGSKCQRHSGKGGPNSNFRIQNDGAFSPGVIQMQFWSRGNGHTDITEKPCLPFLPWLCHLGLQEQKCPLVLGFFTIPTGRGPAQGWLGKGSSSRRFQTSGRARDSRVRLAWALSVAFLSTLAGLGAVFK